MDKDLKEYIVYQCKVLAVLFVLATILSRSVIIAIMVLGVCSFIALLITVAIGDKGLFIDKKEDADEQEK